MSGATGAVDPGGGGAGPLARPGERLETPACPLCGPTPGARHRFAFEPFGVVVCRGCSLQFLSPRLVEADMLRRYQDREYFVSAVPGQGYDEYMDVRHNWHRTFARRLRQIRRYQAPGRVLDVGCGPGFFLQVAAREGYDVWGIDASAYIAGVAQTEFGTRVRQGTLETADFDPRGFDLIVAFDTFEHIYDPLRFLDAARARLAPGGLLAMTTPDPTSLLARVSGRRWVSFKLPEHVFYWSRGTMARAMEGRFTILEAKPAGQYASLSFLARRVLGVGAAARGRRALEALDRFSLYADNGSLTVIARRT